MDEIEKSMWAPLDPAYEEPTADQLAQFRRRVEKAAWDLAEVISNRAAPGEGEDQVGRATWRALQDTNLAQLRALREIGPLADELATEAAKRAGAIGATYPQLGTAWGVTRQSARTRWPGVTRIVDTKLPEAVDLQMAGGEARISWDQAEGGWWWIATAANRRIDEAETTYDSKEEAAGYAGAFLLANQTTTTEDAR